VLEKLGGDASPPDVRSSESSVLSGDSSNNGGDVLDVDQRPIGVDGSALVPTSARMTSPA
jgi:hypothetical protein